MVQFRHTLAEVAGTTIDEVLASVLRPGNFFVGPQLQLEWAGPTSEEVPWEVFRGRLLEPRFTRETEQFRSWNVYTVEDGVRSALPLLSLKLATDRLFVVRGLLCHVWESHAEGNVILSREGQQWQAELVGSIDASMWREDPAAFQDELICLIWQAVVGTSRLPLNSVETPLPWFALGQLGYCFRADGPAQSVHCPASWAKLAGDEILNSSDRTKIVEAALRAAPGQDVKNIAKTLQKCMLGGSKKITQLLRRMFDEVSLSPYTHFVDNSLLLVQELVELGTLSVGDEVDFLSYLLRQQGRHLTAYDLVLFHHRGANYPDALLLQAVLGRYLQCIENHAALFAGSDDRARQRRRALRQALLLRRHYEGHAVPDAPTSPGENTRVLPAPFARVPEEQISQPARRRKWLFQDQRLEALLTPTVRTVLEESLRDLAYREELIELGMAVFIDRPLGIWKQPGEPDHTPLLAHEAFSANIAKRRLIELERLASELKLGEIGSQKHAEALSKTMVKGLPIESIAEPGRPTPSLADARKVAGDFVAVRTLRRGLRDLATCIDPQQTQGFSLEKKSVIVARVMETAGAGSWLGVFDSEGNPCWELVVGSESSRGTHAFGAGKDGMVSSSGAPESMPPMASGEDQPSTSDSRMALWKGQYVTRAGIESPVNRVGVVAAQNSSE